MAAANPNAVQILKQQFPAVDEATINDVLYKQCNGDSNAAIIILIKIQEFNASMQPRVTAQATPLKAVSQFAPTDGPEGASTQAQVPVQTVVVQAVQPHQVPLQIINNPNAQAYQLYRTQLQQRYPSWNLNLEPSAGCRCCSPESCPCCMDSCPSCYLVPDQYTNGLYPIDLKLKNAAFIVFIVMSFYGEISLVVLDSADHGYYLPVVGMVFMLIGALAFYRSSSRDPSTINKVITYCYYLGGALYLAGYVMYMWRLKGYNVCDNDGVACDCSYTYGDYYGYSNYRDDDEFCECDNGEWGDDYCENDWGGDWKHNMLRMPQFYLFRGVYILYHCVLMGLHHASPRVNCQRPRISLIQWDAVMFGLWSCLVLSSVVHHWIWMIAFSGMSHFWLGIVSFSNACVAQEWTNKGGCTGFSATGALMYIFFVVDVIAAFGVLLDMCIHADWVIEPNVFDTEFFLWAFADVVFGAFQFAIYLRMIHPTFVTMCCSRPQKDGTVAI